MVKSNFSNACILTILAFIFSLLSCSEKKVDHTVQIRPPAFADTALQRATLQKIVSLLPQERLSSGRVSFLDETFSDWLSRTGEMPPDFSKMPSIPFLPDPLILDEGGQNIPVKNMEQWKEKREIMKKQLEYYITGTYPPPPDNLKARILDERKEEGTTLRMIELSFGPGEQAKLTIELMIPSGKGPFPVFLTQWSHRDWAQIAVRRGYVGCVYAGGDSKDDTEKYSEIWAGQYDFTRLMRRSYGAYRAIDYLYTLPYIDREKIGITGHSRNGKLSLMAAAFDERIKACIPVSGGTGSEVPWRYYSQNYDIEDLALLTCGQPSWFHPRLRFFVGRENKLPVDQNFFMALIAPRGLMLTTALSEEDSNIRGIEEAYHSAAKVYKFLGAENNLAIRSRYGLHGLSAGEIENYVDFFDYIFKRSNRKPENRLYCSYSFDSWRQLSKENIKPENYTAKGINDIESDASGNRIGSVAGWEEKKSGVVKSIKWGLGDEPSGVRAPGPGRFRRGGQGEDSFGSYLERPKPTKTMGVMAISPYSGFGDHLYGYLYYPADEQGNLKNQKLPVVIYLHEYDYSKGFDSHHQVESLFQSLVETGYAVFAFDMLGFGNRIEEGTHFYDRYPNWSKLGKMVTDVRGAVDALTNLDFIDASKIYIEGYSLGGMVGLYTAALDERIAGVISVAGFTPMRLNTADRGTEGIKAYSHLHGLLPRLGFFEGKESHIPYDFHEILACIAPRPVLVIAPTMDNDAHYDDIKQCVEQSGKIFDLYGARGNLQLFSPDDYNRFSPEMRVKANEWLLSEKLKNSLLGGK